jgi:hypothetical protein
VAKNGAKRRLPSRVNWLWPDMVTLAVGLRRI